MGHLKTVLQFKHKGSKELKVQRSLSSAAGDSFSSFTLML
jgi:hypothetical protein